MTKPLHMIVFWGTFVAGFASACWHFLQSRNGTVLDDEIGHYIICRDAWQNPTLLLNPWGRFLNSMVYFVPSYFGFDATRWFSLILVCATVWITYRLAIALNIRFAFLIPLFFWFQPWVLLLSHSCLTEIPFMLFLVAGTYCLVTSRHLAAALLIGSLPLIRHEGIALVGIWGIVALLKRRWGVAAMLALPISIYNVISYVALGDFPFLIYLTAKPTEEYGSGRWTQFFQPLATKVGLVTLLSLYGLPLMLKTRGRATILAIYSAYFIIHTIIYKFGLFASGGYVYFLFPLVPIIAILAALGAGWLVEELTTTAMSTQHQSGRSIHTIYQYSLIFIISSCVLVYGIKRAYPIGRSPLHVACASAARWLRDHGSASARIEATHVRFYLELPLGVQASDSLWDKHKHIDKLPDQTIVVWDSQYSDACGLPRSSMEGDPESWELLERFGTKGEREVIIFRKRSRERGTQRERSDLAPRKLGKGG